MFEKCQAAARENAKVVNDKDKIEISLKTDSTTDRENKNEIDYKASETYWATQPATVNGMLGGFDFVSQVDIEHSQKFLDFFLNVNIIIKLLKK